LETPVLTVPQLRDITKKTDSTYSSGYGWFRSESAFAHGTLARALEYVVVGQMQNNPASKTVPLLKESIQAGFKALEALGVGVIDKKTNRAPVTQDIALWQECHMIVAHVLSCVSLALPGSVY
jgi:hypothetical protein